MVKHSKTLNVLVSVPGISMFKQATIILYLLKGCYKYVISRGPILN